MKNILDARYQESKNAFLDQLATMNRSLEEYAEKSGGVDRLAAKEAKIYHGRKAAIITIVHFQDTADEYVGFLLDWIDDLIKEKNDLKNDLKTKQFGWTTYFPKMAQESEKEHRRFLSKQRAELAQPDLF